MSAWMFDEANMDRLLAAIQYAAKNGHPTRMTLLNPVLAAKALFEMNAEALRQRYSDADATGYNEIPKGYHWREPRNIDPVQMCKTVHCFLYQCSEGNVPETAFFKEIDAMRQWFDERVGYGEDGRWSSETNERAYSAAVWG